MEIKEQIVEKKQYSVDCQKCGRTIVGSSESQVLYNLRLHLDSHTPKTNVELTGEQITSDSPEPITSQDIVRKIMDEVEKSMKDKGR